MTAATTISTAVFVISMISIIGAQTLKLTYV